MARQPRYALPDIPQHVVQRGNNRGTVFFADSDYVVYRECLGKYASELNCKVHAYVLMTNHVHVLVTPSDTTGLSRLMQDIGRKYVGYINNRYERTGGLWEGRYHATPVETDRYLLTCYRYIELNPVRAGIVSCPEDYLWSSYRRNAFGKYDEIVTPHALYEDLGADEESRRAAYRALFADDVCAEDLELIRTATLGGWVVGGEAFAHEVNRRSGRPALPRTRGGARRKGV